MKYTKRILVLVLAFAMIFTLVACAKKPIDYKKFKDVLEDDKFDFDVTKGSPGKDIDKYYYASDEDGDYFVTYTLYEDADDAEDEIEDYLDEIKDAKDDDEFDGKISESGSGKYKKIVVNGEHEDDGDMYVVIIRSNDMLIMAGTQSTKKRDVAEIDKIVKALGY